MKESLFAELDAKAVEEIATMIANCDFRVTVSRYISMASTPWVITVGENDWSTHLVIRSVKADGSDADLAVLAPEESEEFGLGINTENAVYSVMLRSLIADGYSGVKTALKPVKMEALERMPQPA